MTAQNQATSEANIMVPAAHPAETQMISVRNEPTGIPDSPPPGLSAAPGLTALLRSLRRRWMTAFSLSTLLSMVAGTAAFFLLSPSYTAFSQIKVLPYDPFVLSAGLVQSSSPASYMKSQAAYLRSHVILQKAAKDEKVRNLNLEAAVGSVSDYFEKNLVIESQESSELLTVKFSADDPNKAKTIVQAITDAYREYVEYNEKQTRNKRVDELVNARTRLMNEIAKKKDQIRNSKANEAALTKEAIERQRDELTTTLRDLRTARLDQSREIAKVRAQLAAHQMRRDSITKFDILEPQLDQAIENDPTCRELTAKIEKLKAIVRTFEERHSGTTPTRTSAEKLLASKQQMLADRRKELRDEIKRKIESRSKTEYSLAKDELGKTLTQMEEKEKELGQEFDKFKEQLAKLSVPSVESDQVHEEIQQKQHMVDNVTTALHKLEIDLTSPLRISILQEADVQAKDSKKQMIAAVASPLAVSMLVCMAVAWSDFRRRRLYSASEVSHGLGMRVLGVIPDSPRLEEHILDIDSAPMRHGQSVTEWVDCVRTVILHDSRIDGSKVFLVTSADTGEGKSTVAAHLAASMSRAGRRTLLIDGDLRRPYIHDMFNLPMHPGLSEVIMGEAELTTVLYETPEEYLTILPAGQWDRQVIQAIARNELGNLLKRLQEMYDYIIIDSHPILDATDALLMSKQVDSVILTAMKQQTQLPRLYTASQRLQALHVNVPGVVVNGVDPFELPPQMPPALGTTPAVPQLTHNI